MVAKVVLDHNGMDFKGLDHTTFVIVIQIMSRKSRLFLSLCYCFSTSHCFGAAADTSGVDISKIKPCWVHENRNEGVLFVIKWPDPSDYNTICLQSAWLQLIFRESSLKMRSSTCCCCLNITPALTCAPPAPRSGHARLRHGHLNAPSLGRFFWGGGDFRFLLLFPHKQFQRRWVSVCVCVQPAVCDWLLPLTLLLWEALLLSAQTVQVPPAAETLGPPSCRCRSSCETRGEFVSDNE